MRILINILTVIGLTAGWLAAQGFHRAPDHDHGTLTICFGYATSDMGWV